MMKTTDICLSVLVEEIKKLENGLILMELDA